jgi:hypothetical protein
MGSHVSIAEQEAFAKNLATNCQQRKQFYFALLRHRSDRNNGEDNFLSEVTAGHAMPFTTAEMDMRRKAEILQYTGASTQGGVQESRAQKFARVNRGAGSALARRLAKCSDNALSIKHNRPTPTSSSNVPGPIMSLVYDPHVALYNYVGMREDMAQVSVPAPKYPDYDTVNFPNNSVSTVTYNSFSYDLTDPSFVPMFSISTVTFLTLPKTATLTCTVTYNLYVNLSLTVVNTGVTVSKIQIVQLAVQPTVYLMTEPPRYDDFVLLLNSADSIPDGYTGAAPTVPASYKTGNILLGGPTPRVVTFPVTSPLQGILATEQQTDRLALNVFYKLLLFDQNPAVITADAIINLTDMAVTFTMNVVDVTYAVVT